LAGFVPLIWMAACARGAAPPETDLRPDSTPGPPAAVRETVTVRDREQERRIAAMELQLLAQDAQIDGLTRQLDDARQEVVRAMARLRTLATRAEAASGMAEAELALQSLRAKAESSAPELGQAEALLKLSGDEFGNENYGGALYLATQAKSAARAGESRVAAQRLTPRPGEVTFAIPVPLRVVSRGNVREGPGTGFSVAFTLDAGALVLGHSYANEWVRIVDDDGRAGWITRSLVSGRR
jgi:uncharacterized coiled-coil protein SlyX